MKILKILPQNFKNIIPEIIKSIEKGKVSVCPTDTVYGLVCDAANAKAVKLLFKIKKRPKNKPIPIFVEDIKKARSLAKIDREQEKLLKKVWPGEVTVVLKRKNSKIKLYGVDKKTIALRIPKYKLVNTLLKKTKNPLTGTSANISGKPASTKIKEIVEQFENQNCQPDLILDAGSLKKSKPSTVADLTNNKFKIIREGKIKIKI